MVLASEHRKIKLPDGRDFFAWDHSSGQRRGGQSSLTPGKLAPAWPH
jgi:hypothetical protein